MKILLVRNDRFGEFLLTVPAFAAMREAYPEARIILAVDSYVKPLAECIVGIDEVITWDNRRHSFKEMLGFSRRLRQKKIDCCVIFNPSKEWNIIAFFAGIKQRLGYARKWHFLLTATMPDKKHMGQRHEVEYNLELAQLAGVKREEASLSLQLKENKDHSLFERLGISADRPFVVVHPFTSDSVKQWPFENFQKLILELARRLSIQTVIIGGPEETVKANNFFSGMPDTVYNATGKTSLVELSALLSNCSLLISGDSGPVHLAAAVGTPVLALFRCDIAGKNPERWGPWGKNHCVIKKSSLSDIDVGEVAEKAQEMFAVTTKKAGNLG